MEGQFTKFMVSISMSDKRAREEFAGGFDLRVTHPSALVERRQKQVAAAAEIGRDAHRLDREDKLGPIADSGRVMFTKDGQKKVSFAHILEDAEKQGFALVAAYVESVPNRNYRFRLWFERDAEAQLKLTSGQQFLMLRQLNRVYERVYAFDNTATKGSVTFNAVNAMDDSVKRDVRDLRLLDNSARCILREEEPATAPSTK